MVNFDNPQDSLNTQIIEELRRENSELKFELNKKQRVEQALLTTKRRLQRLLSSSPSVIFSSQATSNFGIIFVSKSVEQFGYKSQDFLENINLWQQCIHSDDLSQVLDEISQLKGDTNLVLEYRFATKNGNFRWIQDQRRLILDDTGKALEIIGSWQDITERKLMEQALFHEKELAQNVLQSIGDGVITTDYCGCIQYLNPIAEKITGWNLNSAKGHSLLEVFHILRSNNTEVFYDIFSTVKSSGKVIGLPHASSLITLDGTELAIDGSIAPICNRHGVIIGSVIIFRDVTQNITLARELSWQANHDFLTGLINRREFELRLAETIINARETGQKHTLGYLDLDQFKVVNDTCGHVAGDELLKQIAALLRKRLRNSDILARIGGDEFGIILHECELADASQIFNYLFTLIQSFRFVWQGQTFSLGASMGLVAIDENSQDLNSLLGAADAACYAAKDKGRNRVHIYQADDAELLQQRGERRWVAGILKALEENRFQLYKQPIVPILESANASTHYELLLRMVSDTGQTLLPMTFIPAAEKYGLMKMLDRWVISSFFEASRNHSEQLWQSELGGECVYAINLSGLSINDDQFLTFLIEQFTAHEILPSSICFEITETAAISNLANAVRLIENMKQLGCSFALDDFGSGMSSFNYIKHLPVDYLKIDGSFVKNIVKDSIDSTLVSCMNQIGHEIGMKTIAEFVEDEHILRKLKDLGIDYAQGYAIAKPSPLI